MCKKFLGLLLASTMLLSMLVGCGSSTGNNSISGKQGTQAAQSQEAPKDSEEELEQTDKKELTIWLRGSKEENIVKILTEDVEQYNQKSDGLANISIEYIPYADFVTKLNAAFVAGMAPDIIESGVDQTAIRANLNQFAPLDEFFVNWEDKDNTIFLDAAYYDTDGLTYGVPFSPATYLFFWRKDYFEEAGLDPNTPPEDWDELMEYAKILTIKEGDDVVRGGFFIDVTSNHSPLLFTALAMQAGSTLYDYSTGYPIFNDESSVEALQYISDIAPYSKLHTPAPSANEAVPFISGTSAMGYVLTEQISTMLTNDPSMRDKIGATAYIPKAGGSDVTWCGSRIYAISADSKYKEEAWDFLKYSLSEERVRVKMEQANIVPVNKKLHEEYKSMNEVLHPAMLEAASVGKPYPKTLWTYNGMELQNARQEALYAQKTAKQALDDAVNQIKRDNNLE